MEKINLLVVDDHRLFRKAMVRLLKTFERMGEVWEADNGKECLEKVQEHPVDVVLLDLEMPRMNGVEAAEQLVSAYPNIKIIVLTMHDSEKHMLHMLELGAHSFLLKNASPEELEQAIVAVIEKDFYHSEELSKLLRKNLKEKLKKVKPTFKKTIALTDREREVLALICLEKSTKEISQKLSISEVTINVHKHNLQTKLGVKSAIGLIRFAYESGLLR